MGMGISIAVVNGKISLIESISTELSVSNFSTTQREGLCGSLQLRFRSANKGISEARRLKKCPGDIYIDAV